MATIKLSLNPKKVGNYAFFCPVTRLHLTLSNPVGFTDRVSVYILRALKSKTLIDVNNVVDLETGKLNVIDDEKTDSTEQKQESKVEESVKSEPTAIQDQQEELSQEAEAVVEEAVDEKKNKRGRRAQSNPIDEAAV